MYYGTSAETLHNPGMSFAISVQRIVYDIRTSSAGTSYSRPTPGSHLKPKSVAVYAHARELLASDQPVINHLTDS